MLDHDCLWLDLFLGGTVQPGVLLSPNNSGRFESRFVSLSIEESPALMLRGMAGSTLGIWVAHGEGNACVLYVVAGIFGKYTPLGLRLPESWGIMGFVVQRSNLIEF